MRVHFLGVGDYSIKEVRSVDDPCPLPDRTVRRRLDARDKRLYAPMSNLGDLVYDADAVYIDIPERAMRFTRKEGPPVEGGEAVEAADEEEAEDEGVAMVRGLQKLREEATLDAQMEGVELRLFKGGAALGGDGEEGSDSGHEIRVRRPVDFDEDFPQKGMGKQRALAYEAGTELGWVDADGEQACDGGQGRDTKSGEESCEESGEESGEERGEESGEESDSDAEVGREGYNDSDDPDESDVEEGAEWKAGLAERAALAYASRRVNWLAVVYGKSDATDPVADTGDTHDGPNGNDAANEHDAEEEAEEDFLVPKGTLVSREKARAGKSGDGIIRPQPMSHVNPLWKGYEEDTDAWENSRPPQRLEPMRDWTLTENRDLIINRFVTGDWSAPARAKLGEVDYEEGDQGSDDGGFEDLETGEVHGAGGGHEAEKSTEAVDEEEARRRRKIEKKARFDAGYDDGDADGEGEGEGEGESGDEEGPGGAPEGGAAGGGSSALRPGQELFQEDPWIIEQRRVQAEQRRRNKEFADSLQALDPDERAAVQGYPPGAYVRVVLTQVLAVPPKPRRTSGGRVQLSAPTLAPPRSMLALTRFVAPVHPCLGTLRVAQVL